MTEIVISSFYISSQSQKEADEMIHYERNLELEASPEMIWAVLSRFMHIDEFAPQVKSVGPLTKGANGVGSRRRCHFQNGTSLVEEVTSWKANRGYSVQLSEMSAMPLHEAHAAIAITPRSNNRTRVTWSMDYQVKHGLSGKIRPAWLDSGANTHESDDGSNSGGKSECAF